MFFMIPVNSDEEFRQFMRNMGIGAPNHQQNQMQEEISQNFDDFDSIVQEVSQRPFGKFSQELMDIDF